MHNQKLLQKKIKEKKNERAEKAVGEEHYLVLCLLMMEHEIKETEIKKKVKFADNVEMLMEAGMLCTTDSETFDLFTKNM